MADRNWYKKNRVRLAKYMKAYLRRRVRERKAKLITMFGGKCADCGWRGHRAAFQFDHVRGTKKFEISDVIQKAPWGRLLREIKKCELVCANCHSIRTWNRHGIDY